MCIRASLGVLCSDYVGLSCCTTIMSTKQTVEVLCNANVDTKKYQMPTKKETNQTIERTSERTSNLIERKEKKYVSVVIAVALAAVKSTHRETIETNGINCHHQYRRMHALVCAQKYTYVTHHRIVHTQWITMENNAMHSNHHAQRVVEFS